MTTTCSRAPGARSLAFYGLFVMARNVNMNYDQSNSDAPTDTLL